MAGWDHQSNLASKTSHHDKLDLGLRDSSSVNKVEEQSLAWELHMCAPHTPSGK